jgi:hypothetical protein
VLNELYEYQYPDLRYITFVAGRSRFEVSKEMEEMLGLKLPVPVAGEPELETDQIKARLEVVEFGTEKWKRELSRAEKAIWDIARDRLGKLEIQN